MTRLSDHQRAMERARSQRAHLCLRGLLALVAAAAARVQHAATKMREHLDPKGGAEDPIFRVRRWSQT